MPACYPPCFPSVQSASRPKRVSIVTATTRYALIGAALLVGFRPQRAEAQPVSSSTGETATRAGWTVNGEAGALIGGAWLTGENAPRVTTGAGAVVSLGVRRSAGVRSNAGLSLRVAVQQVEMRELGARWDAGTLTDAQLLGTASVALRRSGRVHSDVEIGAGVAVLSGARSVFPFSDVSRFAPAAEVGIAAMPGGRRESDRGLRPFALVARYSVMRLDPASGTAGAPDEMVATAGWVGRVTIGLRVQR